MPVWLEWNERWGHRREVRGEQGQDTGGRGVVHLDAA